MNEEKPDAPNPLPPLPSPRTSDAPGLGNLEERQLAAREKDLRRIVETAQEGIWLIDEENRTIFANQVMADMLGCSREKLLGMSMYDFMAPQFRGTASSNVSRRRSGIAERHEFLLQRLDGTQVPTEMATSPIFGDAGEYQGALAMVTDISARKQIEQEREGLLSRLASERDWLNAVIEHSTAAITLFEQAQPEIVRLNPEAFRFFGLSQAEREVSIAQFHGMNIVVGTENLAPSTLLARVLQGARLASQECSIQFKDGRAKAAILSASRVRSISGELLGAVAIFEDVSELKRLQQMREEWTQIVAHDLRQPLSALVLNIGYIQSQLREGSTDLQPLLQQALQSGRQLGRLIGDLTDASLVETKRLQLIRHHVDAGELVRGILAQAGIANLAIEISEPLPQVYVDTGRIAQVLTNLLTNAAKYGNAGATIGVRAYRSGSQVEIAVINQGKGLTEAEIPHIFERYRRTGKHRNVSGLGLGLYIASGIVFAHGGTIRCTSVPNGETVFTVALPVDTAALPVA